MFARAFGFEVRALAPRQKSAVFDLEAEFVLPFAAHFAVNVIVFVQVEAYITGECVLLPALADDIRKVIGEPGCDIHADLDGVLAEGGNPILTIASRALARALT